MRRHILWLMALLMVAGVGFNLSLEAQPAPAAMRTLSVATLAPPGSTWMRVFEAWNREVRRRSNQTLQLRFYAGGVQGDEAEVIRKIRNGRLDGGAVTAVGLSQIHRPALVFQLPGMFAGYDNLDRARTALFAEMGTSFQGAGFQLMGWADVGQTRVFSNGEVRAPRDLLSRHPWQWRDDSVMPALLQEIGVAGVVLQVPEVLGAMQTNRVDTVITSPVAAFALQWASRVTHMMDQTVNVTIGSTVFGNTQWNTLTPDQQTILRETGAQFHALARRNLRSDERTALTSLPQHNITVVSLDAGQRAAWEAVFTATRTRLTGQIADAAFIARVRQLGQ
jgi:TRAP-type C4-dicarboxylate transport system substrate-binding protein